MRNAIHRIKENRVGSPKLDHFGPKLNAKTFVRREKSIRGLMATLLICFLAPASLVMSQIKPLPVAAPIDNPLSVNAKRFYGGMKMLLLRSAEKVPAEYYSFKPTEAVRSYGQIIGHIADSHYDFCSMVLGEKHPSVKVEQNKTSKADLIVALKESFSYCDRAYDALTDATAAEMVNFRGSKTPKLGVLTANLGHNGLHYGNLITYMRLKNIIPPTSEPGFLEPVKK